MPTLDGAGQWGDLVAYRGGSRNEPAIGRGVEALVLRGTCIPYDNPHLPRQIGVQLRSTSEQSMRQVTTATADIGASLVVEPAMGKGKGPLGRSTQSADGGHRVKGMGNPNTEFARK
jgi:hypothetical protein